MTTPHIPVAQDVHHVHDLADAILDGHPTITAQDLAVALQLDYSQIKRAGRSGDLPIVRVSPRRLVITRACLVAYWVKVPALRDLTAGA